MHPPGRVLPSIGRRRFLGGLVAVATSATAAAVTSACSKGSGRGAAVHPSGTIVVGNHPLYIDPVTNAAFTAATGVAVEYHEDIGDESPEPRPEALGYMAGRDVVIVSDWAAERLVAHHLARRQVVWAEGMVGIAFDPKVQDVGRIGDLFAPSLRGKVVLPALTGGGARLALGMALLADGVDPAAVTAAQLADTGQRLANSFRIGQVTASATPIEQVITGSAAAAVVRASDVVGVDPADVRFLVPREGGLLLTDVAVAVAPSRNPDGADAYLEFVEDPAHAVERFKSLPVLWPFGPGGPGALDERMRVGAPAVFGDPLRHPAPETRARLHRLRFLDDDGERALAAVTDELVQASG